MKKLFAILLTLALVVGATLTLVACNTEKDKPAKVMNVSLNPEVEFVLDGNGKVLTANASNEEGNLIVSEVNFVGKTAEEAAYLFVQVSHELGFIVKGSASLGENEIEIEISGDLSGVKKLYEDVKGKINQYLSAENITAQIEQVEAMTKAELQELVAECAPYIEKAKLEALDQMELLEELYASRKETVGMYSQQLKNAYYEAKASAMDTAKIQALKEKMGTKFGVILEGLFSSYNEAVTDLENARLTHLVNADSGYQVKLAELRAKKIELLQLRKELAEKETVTDAEILSLNHRESAVILAENALEVAGETANVAIDTAKALLTTAYNMLVAGIESAQVVIADHLDAIMEFQTEQMPVFAEEFETSYATAIEQAKADWQAMKDSLKAEHPAE